MSDLVFVDCETTSLSAEDGEIWEIAMIRRFSERTFERYRRVADPEGDMVEETYLTNELVLEFQIECDLGKADPFSLRIGKYYERYGKRGIASLPVGHPFDWGEHNYRNFNGKVIESKWDAARLIAQFTGGGAHLIGNCVSFDSERMERLLRSYGRCPDWHYHVIDIEPLLVGYAKAKGQDFPLPYSSSEISKWIGVEEPGEGERHTALGDARWVQRQWDSVFGE
jgi:hypothetical protein